MRASYDVVIIGGAAIGSATAFFLSRSTTFSGSVVVIEKDPSYTKCSTTLSLASIRQQFSTPSNILASAFGIDFIKRAPFEFGKLGDIGFKESSPQIPSSFQASDGLYSNYILLTLGTLKLIARARYKGSNDILLTLETLKLSANSVVVLLYH